MFCIKQRSFAFTLVESLVVIVILSILAMLVFSSVSGLLRKADEAHFVGNLRAVSAAVLSLAAEDGGKIPFYIDQDAGASTMWQTRVAPGLGENPNDASYNSPPAIRRSAMHDPGDKTINAAGRRPTRNLAINGMANNKTSFASGATGRPLGSVRYPSRLALLGPGVSAERGTEWGSGARLVVSFILADGLANYMRYPGGMHFAFVDGHVAKLSVEEVNRELNLAVTGRSVLFDTAANNAGEN